MEIRRRGRSRRLRGRLRVVIVHRALLQKAAHQSGFTVGARDRQQGDVPLHENELIVPFATGPTVGEVAS